MNMGVKFSLKYYLTVLNSILKNHSDHSKNVQHGNGHLGVAALTITTMIPTHAEHAFGSTLLRTSISIFFRAGTVNHATITVSSGYNGGLSRCHKIRKRTEAQGWGCSSVVEPLPSGSEAPGSIPSTAVRNEA